jgi:Tol biopolymer transport system component
MSMYGRFVAFQSAATNLVAGDTNSCEDVFVHDRQGGTTERVSVSSAGAQASNECTNPAISADGRFVSFTSFDANLVSGDTNSTFDVFVRDRQSGTTERVSLNSAGAQANAGCFGSGVSADGRFVLFASAASNLVAGDTNNNFDLFVRDRQNGTTEIVSVSTSGVQANSMCTRSSISPDGRFVGFDSAASNLVAGDTNNDFDIFVRDRQNGTTERVSVDSAGAQGNDYSYWATISSDGRFVAFQSFATNLVAGDTNSCADVFVRDRQAGTTERVSLGSAGAQANGPCYLPSISADGRHVQFMGAATNLVPSDSNGCVDVFVRDLQSGTTERVSVDSAGAEGHGDTWDNCMPSISEEGRYVAFVSFAGNLVAGDTNGFRDVFVRDRGTAGPGTDLCQAGTGAVIACPCSNPPANSPRGCDNSSATGGAQLTSSGAASLASDSLVFVTNGERPTATSIVLQGNAEVANGIAFGQGVRCVGGGLKRLYAKVASGGSITAPGPGDPSVSARSAALGDPIGAGTSRWYAVCYRDPLVLGGCPATSTSNITQSQLVNWRP